MRRETPFADIVRHLTPFFVSRQVVRGSGRVGIGQDGRSDGFQISPARRLLRGRGRARDDAEAADHQHARRAARRRREVPAAARHHRRRQPRRGVDVPQARHDGARAGDDRGPVPRRSTSTVDRPVATLHAVSHDPSLHAPGDAARRAARSRRCSCRWSTPSRRASSSRTGFGSDADPRPSTSWTGGSRCSTRLESDPMSLRPRARLGRQAADLLEGYRDRDGLDWARHGCRRSTCSTATSARTRASTTGSSAAGRFDRARHRRRDRARDHDAAGGHPRVLPRPVPGEVPRRGGRRVLGLGHLRPARARLPAARADPRAAAGDQGARRRPPRPLRHREELVAALTGG